MKEPTLINIFFQTHSKSELEKKIDIFLTYDQFPSWPSAAKDNCFVDKTDPLF